MEIDPPKFHSKELYGIYRNELMAWSSLTDLPKCKHALVIAYSLPDDESIRYDVFSEIPLVQLHNDNGLDVLLSFLDKRFLRDGLVDRMDAFEDFRRFTRHEGQSYREYVAIFDRKYMKMKLKKIRLPSEVLVHELLRRSGISDHVKRLILNNIGDGDSDDIYEKVKFFLRNFKENEVRCDERSSGFAYGRSDFPSSDRVLRTKLRDNESVFDDSQSGVCPKAQSCSSSPVATTPIRRVEGSQTFVADKIVQQCAEVGCGLGKLGDSKIMTTTLPQEVRPTKPGCTLLPGGSLQQKYVDHGDGDVVSNCLESKYLSDMYDGVGVMESCSAKDNLIVDVGEEYVNDGEGENKDDVIGERDAQIQQSLAACPKVKVVAVAESEHHETNIDKREESNDDNREEKEKSDIPNKIKHFRQDDMRCNGRKNTDFQIYKPRSNLITRRSNITRPDVRCSFCQSRRHVIENCPDNCKNWRSRENKRFKHKTEIIFQQHQTKSVSGNIPIVTCNEYASEIEAECYASSKKDTFINDDGIKMIKPNSIKGNSSGIKMIKPNSIKGDSSVDITEKYGNKRETQNIEDVIEQHGAQIPQSLAEHSEAKLVTIKASVQPEVYAKRIQFIADSSVKEENAVSFKKNDEIPATVVKKGESSSEDTNETEDSEEEKNKTSKIPATVVKKGQSSSEDTNETEDSEEEKNKTSEINRNVKKAKNYSTTPIPNKCFDGNDKFGKRLAVLSGVQFLDKLVVNGLWQHYDQMICIFHQQLCKQSQCLLVVPHATEIEGYYKTSKKRDMKKNIIPYTASQFYEDKFWFCLKQPSKDGHQIFLAFNDYSVVVDKHFEQLAIECLAVIAHALILFKSRVESFYQMWTLLYIYCLNNVMVFLFLQHFKFSK